MKKIVVLMLFLVLPFGVVNAETLNQYIAKSEEALKKEMEASNQKAITEAEKNKAMAEKDAITNEISEIEAESQRLKAEIEQLQASIEKKDKEIKEIMKFVQISNGESVYLEYAFGASSFTDFIYRVSVAEQLSDYNDNLINEYNQNIKDMTQKQQDLAVKQQEKKQKQEELNTIIAQLASQIDNLSDEVRTYNTEYKDFQSYVNSLKSLGCGGDEEMSACYARLHQYPSANGWYAPLAKGWVTQGYYGRGHNAIDISNYEGAPVYAAATGRVVNIAHASCGRNIVYIVHDYNGSTYTTVYYHLRDYYVSVGQTVYHTTQIGTQGGNPSYDSCTTGSHLDFKLFKGEYGRDFWSLTNGPHRDPRSLVTQIPGEGRYFSHR